MVLKKSYVVLLASAAMFFSLGCGSGESNEPVRVDMSGYDRACSTNDECVAVRACVCNCPPLDDEVINVGEAERFNQARASIECVDNYQSVNNSYAGPGDAACIDSKCGFGPEALPIDAAVPPEDWDRSCELSRECDVAIVNQCVTDMWCAATYEGVAGDAAVEVTLWNRACTEFRDNTGQCDGARPFFRAYCEDELCAATEVNSNAEPTPVEVRLTVSAQRASMLDVL